jgi:soluble lytic murein transglycosylase
VTTYSVQHEIVPSQEVLKDILINEEITKLIQDKGFNIIQNQNIFYAEFGKLIEQSYKALENKPSADKVKEQLSFLRNYLELNQDHLPVDLCLNRLNDFAKAVFRAQFDELARDILKYIIKKNSKEIQEDALYFYLWTYIAQNNFNEALSIAKKYDLISGKTKISDPRLKFWIGFIYEQLNEPKDALSFYEEIISNNPLSYYAIMAVKKVQVLKPESPAVKYYAATTIKTLTPMTIDVSQLNQDYISSLIRLKAWATIDSQRMMKLELKRLKLHSMPKFVVTLPTEKQLSAKSDLHLVNARIILDSQNFLSTFKYLYEVLEKKEVVFNRALLEILYPKPYLADLSTILKKDKLDPIIVLSLIRQESVFNPLARSRVGARGLMQIMPNTAKRIRRSIKDKHLITPKTNMEVGTTYFKGLMNRYEGNLVYVLAAYNAGEGRVDRWRGTLFDSDQSILRYIAAIPFLETRNYVKLIFRNIFFYKLLQEKNELTDPSEPNQIYDVKLGFKH